MFAGAQSWLQYLVWTHMPAHMRLALETMDVITKPKVSQTLDFTHSCISLYTTVKGPGVIQVIIVVPNTA